MIARWLKKFGQFEFEIKHNAGKDIAHADCLSRVQPEEEDTTAFIAALTFEQNVQEQPKNPWMLLQNTDSRNIQRKQQENKNLAKVFSWIKNKQRPDRRNTSWASKEFGKSWVDFMNLAVIDGIIHRETIGKVSNCCAATSSC